MQSLSNKNIMISYGTATVITVMKNKIIEGVVILPGFTKSLNSLFDSTSILEKHKELNLNPPLVGNNSKNAISSGLIISNFFTIVGYLKSLNYSDKLLITGGAFNYLEKYYATQKIDYTYINNTVLLGLEIWSKNFK